MTDTEPTVSIDVGKYQLGWSDEEDYVFKPQRGLTEEIIREMSFLKKEPEWMLDFRLRSYEIFKRKPMPNWGGDTSQIHFDDIYYYIKPTEGQVDAWEELPDSIKDTYEKLGIPLEEQKRLIIQGLEVGQVLEGTVKNITSYGVFVDLGGVDGLVHITDMSYGRVGHPEEMVEVDQKINVVILNFDDDKKRIALGMKQLTPHPWDALGEDLVEGAKVKGRVVVMADYGACLLYTSPSPRDRG